jgi:hypothetical protein
MKPEKSAKPAPKCKITMQYRSPNGFVYELDDSGVPLEIRISREPPFAKTGDWYVAAHQGRKADAIVSEAAATGSEALQRIEQSWVAKTSELNLPAFDWAAVATALQTVRAI